MVYLVLSLVKFPCYTNHLTLTHVVTNTVSPCRYLFDGMVLYTVTRLHPDPLELYSDRKEDGEIYIYIYMFRYIFLMYSPPTHKLVGYISAPCPPYRNRGGQAYIILLT